MSDTLNKKNTVPYAGDEDSIHFTMITMPHIMGPGIQEVSSEQDLIFGDFWGNTRTKQLSVKGDDGVFRDITPEEFARRWEKEENRVPIREKPKKDWNFGDWLGVIFTFGQWHPKEKAPHDRSRQCLEWGGISQLKFNKLISDKDYARLQKKYQPVSALANRAQMEAYIKDGSLPKKGTVNVESAHEQAHKSSVQKVKNLAENFKDKFRTAGNASEAGKVSIAMNALQNTIDGKRGNMINPKLALMTAGYFGNLTQEEFNEFGEEYVRVYKDRTIFSYDGDPMDKVFSNHNAQDVLYNLQCCVALTKGKLSLMQLYEAAKAEDGFVYAEIFPENGAPRLDKLGSALKTVASKENVDVEDEIDRPSLLV